MRALLSASLSFALSGAVAHAEARPSSVDGRCANLRTVGSRQLEILSATSVPGGSFQAAPGTTFELPASCRVRAVSRSVADSEIELELWMPVRWSGRYVQLGNGGFAGNIDGPSLANELRRGNAAAMTDTGHKAGQFDASWALGHPQKLIDYGYRSIKVTSDAANRLITTYYGSRPHHRYFVGCSNGGRQALMAAQRYPRDWDGVLAGSPALEWTKQLATFAAIQSRLRSSAANWILPAKLPLIQKLARVSCSSAKLECRVDVQRFICAGKDRPDCLTEPQAASLELIQSGPSDARGRLFHGFNPRYAELPGNWDQWILNSDRNAPSDLAFAIQAYRNFVFSRADWQVTEFDVARDFSRASEQRVDGRPLRELLDADNPDLSPFAARGGKIIIYVGTADAVISPYPAVAYYEQVARRAGGSVSAQAFVRAFVIRGMQHCQGGREPSAFGQAWVAPALRPDRRHDVRVALEDWVEKGLPPKSLTAVSQVRRPGQNFESTTIKPQ